MLTGALAAMPSPALPSPAWWEEPQANALLQGLPLRCLYAPGRGLGIL